MRNRYTNKFYLFIETFVSRNRNVNMVDTNTEEINAHHQVELQFSQSSQLEALSSVQNPSHINVQSLVLEAYQSIGNVALIIFITLGTNHCRGRYKS